MNQNLIPITINNKVYQVRSNASILQACEEAQIEVPRFCYHEKLSVAGNCRMCLVEVEKSPKPVVSCAMPIAKGMVIYTNTPLVKKARESVLEFLLINHPLDCPICDQGGECDLQDETIHFGTDRGRFFEFKRSVEDKECGPIVKTIMTRCIHCTRCVRFSAEIAGQETLGSFGRGDETEIGTYVQSFIKTELSGNLVDLCPVGALTSKPYAYTARSWELQKGESVDFFDGVCADILVQTRKLSTPRYVDSKVLYETKEEILRILPRGNGLYSDNWISDKTRYAFDGLKKQRLNDVLKIDRKKTLQISTWSAAFIDIAKKLLRNVMHLWDKRTINFFYPAKVVTVIESMGDIESLYVLSTILKFYGSSDLQYGNSRIKLNIDLPAFYNLNRTVESFDNLKSLIIIGSNPRYEASLLNTSFRKQQLNRATPYLTFAPFNDLKYRQKHEGNGLRAVISFLENRTNVAADYYNSENASILLGADSLKGRNGIILQNLARFLGRKLFVKTKKGERLSILHSNITSLNMANLGLDIGVRSDLHKSNAKDLEISNLFVIQPYKLSPKKWISSNVYTHVTALTTHKPTNVNADTVLPIKSLYEKNGYTFNIEGRLRKLYKTVTAPKNARTIESFFIALARLSFLRAEWLGILAMIWNFEDELSVNKLIEKDAEIFDFNYLIIKEDGGYLMLTPFNLNIENFYMTDLITQHSPLMGECSLFLKNNSNWFLSN